MIKDRIEQIRGEIAGICQKLKRDPKEIAIVGVTKFTGTDKIQAAIDAGLKHIGENKVQEGQKKFPVLTSSVTKHLIGHLQTNKVKLALTFFDCIQSVDSLRLAEAIQQQAEKSAKTVDIFLQVNTSGESQKFGASPDDAAILIEQILALSHLRLQGCMAMAPLVDDEKVVRQSFSDLRKIFEDGKRRWQGHPRLDMKYLSMGMTQDYKIALEEGSNMLRIGRAIFGE